VHFVVAAMRPSSLAVIAATALNNNATVTPVASPRNPKPETRNPKPDTRNPKPEIRNPKPETCCQRQ
jgi:hypothetical protein